MTKTIVWDIDDVLNNLMEAWLTQDWLPQYPECGLKYADIKENPPHALLGMDRSVYLDSLDRFRCSAEAGKMTPDAGLTTWFREHGAKYRHVALTARPTKTIAPAVTWTLEHFGAWIQTFCFVPAERPGVMHHGPDQTKADFLRWLGKADYFIDDSAENVEAAEKLGIRAYLVRRPWNNGLELESILGQLK